MVGAKAEAEARRLSSEARQLWQQSTDMTIAEHVAAGGLPGDVRPGEVCAAGAPLRQRAEELRAEAKRLRGGGSLSTLDASQSAAIGKADILPPYVRALLDDLDSPQAQGRPLSMPFSTVPAPAAAAKEPSLDEFVASISAASARACGSPEPGSLTEGGGSDLDTFVASIGAAAARACGDALTTPKLSLRSPAESELDRFVASFGEAAARMSGDAATMDAEANPTQTLNDYVASVHTAAARASGMN